MSEASVQNDDNIRSLVQLFGSHFFIPDYQRGYRWTPNEVNALLDDLWTFFHNQERDGKNDNEEGNFYCLQPIVVRKLSSDEAARYHLKSDLQWWEVVDGQQRLTTLYLISIILREEVGRGMRKLLDTVYTLHYQTRPKSQEFLCRLMDGETPDINNDNIDFYYISHALRAILKWRDRFEENHQANDLSKFAGFIFNGNTETPSPRIIWYEIPPHESAKTIFMRLNTGKIPLSNVELIRSLFLQTMSGINHPDDNALSLQTELAHKWDEIEKKLQDDRLWYFLRNKDSDSIKHFDARIEILFIIFNALNNPDKKAIKKVDRDDLRENYNTFVKFNQHFQDLKGNSNSDSRWGLWKDIANIFDILEEWYESYDLYHIIGLRLELSEEPFDTIIELMDRQTQGTHTEFHHWIKQEILGCLRGKSKLDIEEWIEELRYKKSGNPTIRNTLLAFNIATLQLKSNSKPFSRELASERYLRFPFDRYKTESWDIEHIHSVQSLMPQKKQDMKSWLEVHQKELFNTLKISLPEIDKSIEQLLEVLRSDTPLSQEHNQQFKDVYDALLRQFSGYGSEERDNVELDINNIGNLTLLNTSLNRSYGNALFPIKRLKVIEADKSGQFCPLCTTNAFLKYYSEHVDNVLHWTINDIQDHKNSISSALHQFFSS